MIWITEETKKAENRVLETPLKATQTNPLNLIFLTQELRKFDLNSKDLIFSPKIREFFKIPIMTKRKENNAL